MKGGQGAFCCTIDSMTKTINILFLAAEAEPFIKVGGLADVAGSLPRFLRRLPGEIHLDVRLVLPLHQAIHAGLAALKPAADFVVPRRGGDLPCRAFEADLEGIPVYFIDGAPVAAAASVYSPDLSLDQEKYTFFSLAALELARKLDWRPAILHANDWHTALALYALRVRKNDRFFDGTRAVLTLHNLPYMGGDIKDQLAAYDLPVCRDHSLPEWARAQPLPLGLWAADAIAPVSPTYAREILTPEFGCDLEEFLRGRAGRITGILNGLDMEAWNPATDGALAARYDAENLAARAENKRSLQESLGLGVDERLPLLVMVTRIDPQKGVDLALAALRLVADLPWQFVILGLGTPALAEAARRLEAEMPGRVRAAIRFDAPLGRLIYGGADIILMPSRYEPCGLAQMIAMRYGCVPIVRATGGLKDTVAEGRTGFLFEEASAKALAVYPQRAKWKKLQRNDMKQNFSWQRSARAYADLYSQLIQ